MLSSVWSRTTFANRGKSPSLAVAWGFNVPCLPTLELEEGLEPPTRCLQSSRSTRLSYTSVCVSKCVLTCRLWFNATHRKATIAHSPRHARYIWPCRSLSGIRHSDIIRALPGVWSFREESNHHLLSTNQPFYRLTTEACAGLSRLSAIDEIPAFGTLARSAFTIIGAWGRSFRTSYAIRLRHYYGFCRNALARGVHGGMVYPEGFEPPTR